MVSMFFYHHQLVNILLKLIVDIVGVDVVLPPGVGVDIIVVNIVGVDIVFVNVISVDVVLPPGVGGATADGKQPRLRDPDTNPRLAAKGR